MDTTDRDILRRGVNLDMEIECRCRWSMSTKWWEAVEGVKTINA